MSIGPGIYLRGQVDYDTIDAVNYSTLKELARSPKHYAHRLRARRSETAAMAKGNAAHIAILEPVRFTREYAVFEGARRAGKAWDAFEAANVGKTILKEDEFNVAMAMRDAVRADPVASAYLSDGDHEVTLVWDDAASGVRCKGRTDFVRSDNVIVDVKTTKDPSPFWFGRDVAKYQYHVQAAFYLDALEHLTKSSARYVIIAVESAPPHDVVTYTLDERVLGPGRDAYHQMLKTLVECRETRRWPGYATGVELPLELPPWALGDSEDDLTALGFLE